MPLALLFNLDFRLDLMHGLVCHLQVASASNLKEIDSNVWKIIFTLWKKGYSEVHSLVCVQQQYTYITSVTYVCYLFCTILRYLLQPYIRGYLQRVTSLYNFIFTPEHCLFIKSSWIMVLPHSNNHATFAVGHLLFFIPVLNYLLFYPFISLCHGLTLYWQKAAI